MKYRGEDDDLVWVMLALISLVIIGSLVSFFYKREELSRHFSMKHFTTLVYVYFVVMLGFGLLYFVLASEGLPILKDDLLQHDSIIDRLAHSVYFSGVTLMTVGYGDITPIGIGRILALMEALIGYILPAAFFVQFMQDRQ